ncbi:hypothetical protein Salat_2973600 [Sesamum alatum]|uniref:Uncharacterized protein n=1 Tax=Sesamum alatum TaxID=300844 RepID=A0AAE2C7M5_9LAMI|nr:hypothetical protein Salat_2973600 [Sesamum alatum]
MNEVSLAASSKQHAYQIRKSKLQRLTGRGKPLNPYLRGHIVDYLRHELRPREQKSIPEDLFEFPGQRDFLEWSMLRSWVKDWLRYCRWYYMVALAPTVDLEDSFKVKTGPELVRFGITLEEVAVQTVAGARPATRVGHRAAVFPGED